MININSSNIFATKEIDAMSNDIEFMALADSYIDTIEYYNKTYIEISKRLGSSELLEKLLKYKADIIRFETELNATGYNMRDCVMAKMAGLLN